MKIVAEVLSIGFTIISCILCGTLVGYYLDTIFKMSPLFLIIGILLGTVAAFGSLYALVVKK